MLSTTIESGSQTDTEDFGRQLSMWLKPGFAILLRGDLGSGKSTLARSIIRALAAHLPELDVPSPSFSLLNQYDMTRVPIAHVDLYRLDQASAVEELGLSEILIDHAVIVEWPEHLPPSFSTHCLIIAFSGDGEKRSLQCQFSGQWEAAWQRHLAINAFLARHNWQAETRSFLEGDASSRRYEMLTGPTRQALLMDMPHRPDGPPVRNGLPYSAIAHLAEGLSAVIGVNRQLRDFHYSAPEVYGHDITQGLAVIELLDGAVYGKMRQSGVDMNAPMLAAVDVLADMAHKHWPIENVIDANLSRIIPHYDQGAMLIEVDLILSWYFPYRMGKPASEELQQSFANVWLRLFPKLVTDHPVWVMRDYHSPNLLWLPEREGLQRVGIIDSQDAVMGHPAYDLVSLLQDARLDIPEAETTMLYQHYEVCRKSKGGFDSKDFARAYAILGAQRATKILGIFARLAKRDGKPGYLRHMPRVARYLLQNLDHPELHELKLWFSNNLPDVFHEVAR
jgi:N-acetylmuramate 1-kinase